MSNLVVARRSLLLGSAAVALIPAVAFADGPDIGKPAPLFTAVDSNGKTWSLADLKGKVVVIETTNDGCPYVRKHYTAKNMQDQQREAAECPVRRGASAPAEVPAAEQQHGEYDPGEARQHGLVNEMLREQVVDEHEAAEQREREDRKAGGERLERCRFERFH